MEKKERKEESGEERNERRKGERERERRPRCRREIGWDELMEGMVERVNKQ